MTDTQWEEIEAMVKYMVDNPGSVDRMMPHLRRAVEQMPRRWNWWWSWGKKVGEKL